MAAGQQRVAEAAYSHGLESRGRSAGRRGRFGSERPRSSGLSRRVVVASAGTGGPAASRCTTPRTCCCARKDGPAIGRPPFFSCREACLSPHFAPPGACITIICVRWAAQSPRDSLQTRPTAPPPSHHISHQPNLTLLHHALQLWSAQHQRLHSCRIAVPLSHAHLRKAVPLPPSLATTLRGRQRLCP